MTRARILVALVLALLAAAAPVRAQDAARVARIGFLGMDAQAFAPLVAAFRESLLRLGYVEGRNVVIEFRWAEGRLDRLPALAKELAALPVDVLVTAAPPAVRAAQQATATIPIVMMSANPVALGFAESLARPGRNITGVAFQDAELSTKRLDLLRQLVPGLTRVAVVWNREGPGPEAMSALTAAAAQLGMQVLPVEVAQPSDLGAAIAQAKAWGAQGVVQLASPRFYLNRKLLVDALAAHRMPASCETRAYVAEGCLTTYSANYGALMARLASFADRILKGARPADLPIEQPHEFDVVVNLKTAQALGLAPSSALLVQATEVIR